MNNVESLIRWMRENGRDEGFGYPQVVASSVPPHLQRYVRVAEETGRVARDGSVLAIVESQFQWHYKMRGYRGPCPVCGCEARRLKARHRALPADEAFRRRVLWEKSVKVCFGTDSSREAIQ